jgi:NADH-quinone oxidoreductase subunit G
VVRIKPRYNPDVNEWWMCDEGRYGFGWVDKQRLTNVRGPSGDATWEQALTTISTALTESGQKQDGSRIGVIASAQLTNEELFLVQQIFQRALGAQVSGSAPEKPGSSDDFLVKADKNPNTLGATLLGFAGPDALDAAQLVDAAIDGNLDALWVFGHDLVKLFGEQTVRQLSIKVPLFVYSGTNENPTVPLAHWILPSAAYVEKDGTFVNCHGRLQRIGRAFPPLKDAREDWCILLELAGLLGLPLKWREPKEIFGGLAEAEAPFAGLSYKTIGNQGAQIAHPSPASGAPAP